MEVVWKSAFLEGAKKLAQSINIGVNLDIDANTYDHVEDLLNRFSREVIAVDYLNELQQIFEYLINNGSCFLNVNCNVFHHTVWQ